MKVAQLDCCANKECGVALYEYKHRLLNLLTRDISAHINTYYKVETILCTTYYIIPT